MAEVIIKKGNMELVKTDRSNIIEVQQTPDGIIFSFKQGFILRYDDQHMPISVKDIIVNTSNSFPSASLVYDLGNYKRPVIAKID